MTGVAYREAQEMRDATPQPGAGRQEGGQFKPYKDSQQNGTYRPRKQVEKRRFSTTISRGEAQHEAPTVSRPTMTRPAHVRVGNHPTAHLHVTTIQQAVQTAQTTLLDSHIMSYQVDTASSCEFQVCRTVQRKWQKSSSLSRDPNEMVLPHSV